ncbi:MAG TPA: EpsD family peptidyl-prolyl cis-trans isomerase [Burkholderiales bacterium]|nr:EpsD family peptidyl-prolyl cis-trans isomerase [Burkholderiales bacterium]
MTAQLAAEALARRLDRASSVQQALEGAKTEVLARAYLEELGHAQPEPSAVEVRQYYGAHPELFAERRVFTLEQIDVARTSPIAAALRERAASPGATFEAIADWLRARDVPHSVTRGVRTADRIPLELLPRLQAMRQGELAVMETADALLVIRIVAQRQAPFDEASATPLIEQYLRQRRWEQAVAAELARHKVSPGEGK